MGWDGDSLFHEEMPLKDDEFAWEHEEKNSRRKVLWPSSMMPKTIQDNNQKTR